MPLFGLGTFECKGDAVKNAIKWSLEAGYRHIDSAQMYRNETEIGQAIKESGVKREDIFITTKLWNSEHGRVEESLK